MEQTTDEIKRLQGCINDLISIQALPAIWSGQESSQIVSTLFDVLVRVLRLDFAYAWLSTSIYGSPVEMIRLGQRRTAEVRAVEVGRAFAGRLTGDRPYAPFMMPNPIGEGEVSVAPLRLWLQDEVGVLVAGSTRVDFPTEIEMLLLRVAANQAAIGLREAQEIVEHKRAEEELEQRVVERTGQLIALNEDLNSEIIERERAEEALHENEQRLRAILENSPAIIFLKDNDGRYLECNPPFEKLCGLSRDQIIGKSDWELFPREQAAQFCSNDVEVLKAGRPMEFEETALHLDGPHTSIVSMFPLRDREGHTYAIGGIVTDITERKRVEKVLQESEERFRLMVEGVKEYAIFMLDPEGRVTSWNAGAERIKGYREEEILGKHFSLFFPPEEIAKGSPERQLRLAAAADRIEDEGWRVRKDGTPFLANIIITAIRDEKGKLIGFSKVISDVTERRRVEEELHTAREELARTSRVVTMGELTASIAHEVNQPLTAVVTNADAGLRWLAGATPNLEEARAALVRIRRDGNRASDVITRIRMLVRKTGTEKEMLEMNEVIQETVALAQGEVRRKGVALRTELAGDLPLVQGDRVQLQQVMLNLIMNGMEAMSAVADRPRELDISTWKDQVDKIRVTVKDVGVGLEPPSVERVFEAFYTTKPQGIGIGLSISRSIIEAHNGRLWATRNDGPGATFQFTLPIYDAAAE
jgi:PAS domain S-box-containing protein